MPGDLWLKAEALRLGQPDPWGTYLPPTKDRLWGLCAQNYGSGSFYSSGAQPQPSLPLSPPAFVPTLMQTVTNTYRVSSFSLLSRKTRLSSFSLKGRGDQLRGGQVRGHSHLLWKAGQDPLCMKRMYRTIPSRLQSRPGRGYGPAWHLGVLPTRVLMPCHPGWIWA